MKRMFAATLLASVVGLASLATPASADWLSWRDSAEFFGTGEKDGEATIAIRCARANEFAFFYMADANQASGVAPGMAVTVEITADTSAGTRVVHSYPGTWEISEGLVSFPLGGEAAHTIAGTLMRAVSDIVITVSDPSETVLVVNTFTSAGSTAAIRPIIDGC